MTSEIQQNQKTTAGRNLRSDSEILWPGILADARALGVCRVHLWRVLMGTRASRSLLNRYASLSQTHRERLAARGHTFTAPSGATQN